jgi:aminotransferase
MTILRLAEQHDAFVITDEPYEHIVLRPACACSFRRAAGGLRADHHLQFALEDLFHHRLASRLRAGRPHVIAQARKVHDFLTVGAAAPLQEAAVAGLELPDIITPASATSTPPSGPCSRRS